MDVDFTEKNIADETAKMDISQDISIWVTPPSPKLGVGTTSCHTEPQLLDNIAVINKKVGGFRPNSKGQYFSRDDMIEHEVSKIYQELSTVSEEEEVHVPETTRTSICLEEVQGESIFEPVTRKVTPTFSRRLPRLTSWRSGIWQLSEGHPVEKVYRSGSQVVQGTSGWVTFDQAFQGTAPPSEVGKSIKQAGQTFVAENMQDGPQKVQPESGQSPIHGMPVSVLKAAVGKKHS